MKREYLRMIVLLLLAFGLASCKKAKNDGNEANPTVISTDIFKDAVSQEAVITATFSAEMLSSSITDETFIVMQGNTPIEGTISYDGKKATFIPSTPLLSGSTKYTGRITTGVKDAKGIPLKSDYVWEFTTTWSIITATAGPNGSITPAGEGKINMGFAQTYTITPNSGYYVSELMIDGVPQPSPFPSIYTFKNVTSDHAINVNFSAQAYTVTATAEANGNISPSGISTASYGDSLVFSITPNPGYFIADIVVDGESVNDATPSLSYGLKVKGDHTIAVSFTNQDPTKTRYILVNIDPSSRATDFSAIASLFKSSSTSNVKVGIGFIISYLNSSPASIMQILSNCFALSEQYNIPIVIQPDGEQWWDGRPDLWNWWDPSKPGYNPANKNNVEWTDWSSESAVKIGWRNWGRQLRVKPMPNLMSPAYRQACHTEMQKIVTATLNWWKGLPLNKKHLFLGLKIGWESAVGVNNWYYPDGNSYLDKPEANDPTQGIKVNILPSRGVTAMGYAGVKTAGIASSGTLKEADVAAVVQSHIEDLCRQAADLGVPRERLFTHAGGWAQGELLYKAAVNPYSCPGWSFYDYATNPANDATAMQAVASSNAPYWGAVEWLYLGQNSEAQWKLALSNTLAIPRLRYVNIFNWNDIKNNTNAVSAIQDLIK